MLKMDRIINSKVDKQSIYEIYRACRLCGAGAGYKMPIIQNVIDLEADGVELKKKIQECLQIEVHQDDKMPPLICELCVDKVNDFYHFFDMCRETNKRTRMRLGLPLQSVARGTGGDGDCILGMTEPVYVNEDSNEPLSKHRPSKDSKKSKVKIKKEPEVQIKLEPLEHQESRSSSKPKSRPHMRPRQSTPPKVRTTRSAVNNDNVALSSLKTLRSTPPAPKSILKKDAISMLGADNSLLVPRVKRLRDTDFRQEDKPEVPVKKVKISEQPQKSSPKLGTSPKPISSKSTPKPTSKSTPPKPTSKSTPPKPTSKSTPPKPSPSSRSSHSSKSSQSPKPSFSPKPTRSSKPPPKRPPTPPPSHPCPICDMASRSSQGLASHMKSHTVTYTNPKLACNACEEWFTSQEQMEAHQRRHRKGKPYHCRKCSTNFKLQEGYDDHFDYGECEQEDEKPDVRCDMCWGLFATDNLLEQHKCGGVEARPGDKCSKCGHTYALLKNLTKHESTCTGKKKGELTIDPELMRNLKPFQVRVARCDPLLVNVKQERYDVSSVSTDYGLDKNCVYPYISSFRIKSELSMYDGMVAINDDIKDEFCTDADFVHWDSEDSEDSESEVTEVKNPQPLLTLTLKTIFSQRFIGKVPRKRKRVKIEKPFDTADFDIDVSKNINSIIDKLDSDVTMTDTDETDNLSESLISNNLSNDKIFNSLLDESQCEKENVNKNLDEGKSQEDVVKETSTDDMQFDQDKSFNNSTNKNIADNIDGQEKPVETNNDSMRCDSNDQGTVVDVNDFSIKKDIVKEKSSRENFVKDNDDSQEKSLDRQDDVLRKDFNEKETIKSDNLENKRCADISETTVPPNNGVPKPVETLNEVKFNKNDESIQDSDSHKPSSNISSEQTSLNKNNDEDNEKNYIRDKKLDEVEKHDGIANSSKKDNGIENINSMESSENVMLSHAKELQINGQHDKSSLNMDDLDDVSETEMDDKCLMDALDAQIGESNDGVMENNEKSDGIDTVNVNNEKNNDTASKDNSDVSFCASDNSGEKKQCVTNNSDSNSDSKETSDKNENNVNTKNIEQINENNDNIGQNNDKIDDNVNNAKDQVTLEDLVPVKNNLREMDLDSISDDDFNFDNM